METKEKKALLRKIGHLIKIKRVEKRLTQYELAEVIECNAAHLGQIERGTVDLSYSMIVRISRGLQISPKDLMTE